VNSGALIEEEEEEEEESLREPRSFDIGGGGG
jgi:hypothetical protein